MSILDLFKKDKKPATKPQPANPKKEASSAATDQSEAKPSDPKTEKPVEAKRVYNLIILDKSGSMISIYQAALTGVNETLQTIREAQKEHETQKHYVTLISFSTGHYKQIYNNTPAEKVIDITKSDYRPNGGTPLYDTMGQAINELRQTVEKGDIVLVTIITDGYENASREYNNAAIKSLVEAMKKEGWVFTYIGANQDVQAVSSSLSIDNSLTFESNYEATRRMFVTERRSRKRFFESIDTPEEMNDLMSGNFFNNLDEDEDSLKS